MKFNEYLPIFGDKDFLLEVEDSIGKILALKKLGKGVIYKKINPKLSMDLRKIIPVSYTHLRAHET